MSELSKSEQLEKTVIRGTHDFLFCTDHGALEQLTGQDPLSAAELRSWVNSLTERFNWCQARGIELRMMFVPEKHVIYQDYIPEITISENRPVVQILNALPDAVRQACLYPLKELLDARKQRDVYYRTDTHWNNWGGFIGYNCLIDSLESLGIDRVKLEDLLVTSRKYLGDLGVRLEPEEEEVADVLSHATKLPFKRIYDNSKFSRGNTAVYESTRTSAHKTVIFRDSFFNLILPHVIPVFSRTVAVSSLDMHCDLILSEKSDVVIFEVIERFVAPRDSEGNRVVSNNCLSNFADISGVSPEELAQFVT
jgi:hypothetical protein